MSAVVLPAALASVLAHASALDGRLDGLSHFAPLYLAVGLLGLALMGQLRGRRITVLAATIAAVAAAAQIVPEFMRTDGASATFDASRQVKVVQINAQLRNGDVARVAGWLVAQNPDVITVTEARHDLRDLLVKQGWQTAGAQGSLMMFTREPYVRMDRPDLEGRGQPTFVNATYRGPLGEVEIVTVRVDRSKADVSSQVRNIETIVGRLPRERMILTGDFNLTPWSAALRRLDGSLGLIRRDRALASWPAEVAGRTWPAPLFPIDHVYAGPAWATVKVERGPWVGSDHYPVVVTLAPASRP